jgi:hypothetical protein
MTPVVKTPLALRIVVVGAPPGVAFAVQRGRDGLVPPARVSRDEIAFEVMVEVSRADDGSPRILGPFAHGPPADRFLYLASGMRAGQLDSRWTRRAKVKTSGITRSLVDEVLAAPGAVLEARIAGTARDGGPCCATVPLLGGGWALARPYSGAGPAR